MPVQNPFTDPTFPQEWFPGWWLVGRYESGVGCWLLAHGGEALLLEVPEGLMTTDVARARRSLSGGRPGPRIRYVTASHDHWDHLDSGVWSLLRVVYPDAEFLLPGDTNDVRRLDLGGEPLYLIPAPKHSPSDQVVVFRGVVMTGDLELGTLGCCGDGEWAAEDLVPMRTRSRSYRRLRDFPWENDYRIHTVVSAHLDDVRRLEPDQGWAALFPTEEPVPN